MEMYKTDPNDNLFLQSRARKMVLPASPNEMPWPDPSEKDVVYIAWSNYTKGYAAGFEAGKASLTNQALEAEVAAMKAVNGN